MQIFPVLLFLFIQGLLIPAGVYAKNRANLVIAHRGAPAYVPEHTLLSYTLAHGFDPDYIETDIVLTKDQEPILLHDIYLEPTTNVASTFPKRHRKDGHYYAIDFTAKEINTLNVNERIDFATQLPVFPARFPQNKSLRLRVPTLEEFLVLIDGLNKSRHRSIGIYPEIKSPEFHQSEGKDITKIVLDRLAKHHYLSHRDHVFLQCFDPKTLRRIRFELKSKLPLIQLIGENSWEESSADYAAMLTPKGLEQVSKYAEGIGPWLNQILPDSGKGTLPTATSVVENAHKLGLKVHVYTLRQDQLPSYAKDFNHLAQIVFTQLKIDGAFTDFPDKLSQFLQKK